MYFGQSYTQPGAEEGESGQMGQVDPFDTDNFGDIEDYDYRSYGAEPNTTESYNPSGAPFPLSRRAQRMRNATFVSSGAMYPQRPLHLDRGERGRQFRNMLQHGGDIPVPDDFRVFPSQRRVNYGHPGDVYGQRPVTFDYRAQRQIEDSNMYNTHWYWDDNSQF